MSDRWSYIEFPLIESANKYSAIREVFNPAHARIGTPEDMAVLSKHEYRDTGSVSIGYFSPKAVEIGHIFGAVPCDKPSKVGLGVEAGVQGAIEAFYPAE